jgi:MFS family permease
MADIIDAAAQPRSSARAGFPRFRFVVVGLMFVGSVILWADRLNVSVAAPEIVKAYGWTPSVLGAIFSSFTFGYLITQIPGGRLGDAMPRRILGWTGVLWSLFTAITPFGRTPLLMGSIRFALGLSEGPFLPTTVAVLARWVPRTERASVNGVVTSASNWAPVLFLPFAAYLVHTYGWPSTFYVFAAIGLAWAVVWLVVARDRPEDHPSVGSAELARILEGRGIGAKRLPLGPVLKRAATWGTILGWIGVPFSNYMMLSWLPTLFATRFHVALLKAGFLSALPFLCSIVGQIVGGVLLDRMTVAGVKRENAYRILIGVGMFGCAICFYLTTQHFEVGPVTVLISLGMGILGLCSPQFWTLPMDISPARASAIAGAMNAAGIAGAVVSPFLTGWIVQTTGEWYAAFYLAAIILVCAAACALVLLRGPLAVPDEEGA